MNKNQKVKKLKLKSVELPVVAIFHPHAESNITMTAQIYSIDEGIICMDFFSEGILVQSKEYTEEYIHAKGLSEILFEDFQKCRMGLEMLK